MVAGGLGDHPLTDVLNFKLTVYGKVCDDLIRQISKFVSINTMYHMWDWFKYENQNNNAEFEAILRLKLNQLQNEAKLNGWEDK